MGLRYLINYVRTEKCYFYFLIFQLILIIGLIVFVFTDFENQHNNPVVIALEIIITAIVFLEIATRICIQKRNYFRSIWNVADLVSMTAIVTLYIVFAIMESKSGHSSGKLNVLAILLGIRYLAQIIRIMVTLKENRDVSRQIQAEFNIESGESDKDRYYQPLEPKMTLILDDREEKDYDTFKDSNY